MGAPAKSKDAAIQGGLATLMVAGVVVAATIILIGLVWYLAANLTLKPGDHIFSGEPKYFTDPVETVRHAFHWKEVGHRRSFIMIGIVLLLINPAVRVAFAAVGFAVARDRLYAAISAIVLAVLVFSFFW